MGGENYDDLDCDTQDDERRLRQQLMLRTREAMFLIDPETSEGLGAKVDRSLEEPLQRLFTTYRTAKLLAGLNDSLLHELLLLQTHLLRANRYPPGGADPGGRYLSLATKLAEAAVQFVNAQNGVTVGPEVIRAQIEAIDEHLAGIVRVTRLAADKQLDNLVTFLETWECPARNGKFDLRLAITITKSDLLRCTLPDDRKILEGVGRHTPWEQWRRQLQRLSDESQAVLDQYEPNLVATASQYFRKAGFFFISSLGRPVEYDIDKDAARIRTIMSPDASGARTLAPRGVLWPVLWLSADAR
jgi:hypothetical protein